MKTICATLLTALLIGLLACGIAGIGGGSDDGNGADNGADNGDGNGSNGSNGEQPNGNVKLGSPEYLVGVYYFSGWWERLPNHWHRNGQDWRPNWPERVPLLGEYNNQATMDREIIAAAEHGVDYFQIIWFPPPTEATADIPEYDLLNEGLRNFMASPHNDQMKFTLEWINHWPFDLPTDVGWETAARAWVEAMKHPSYLRVGNRPVFKIYDPNRFLAEVGHDLERARARLNTLRRIAAENGVPSPIIGSEGAVNQVSAGPLFDLFDFLSRYNAVVDPPKDTSYPFQSLTDFTKSEWVRYGAHGGKHYVPYLMAGWDVRPWLVESAFYDMPTREQWRAALTSVRQTMDSYPTLGLPKPGGGTQKTFIIFAWNEFGEGGIVAPNHGDGYMKLEVIREVFGTERPVEPCPVPEGFFRLGEGIYFSNGSEYCAFPTWESYLEAGGPADKSGLLELNYEPSCMHYNGACRGSDGTQPCPLPEGFFSVGDALYYSDGSAYCLLRSWTEYFEAGGPADTSSIPGLSSPPACMENHGYCAPSSTEPCPVPEGFFKIGETIYFSSGTAFCSYASWEAYVRAGGPTDTSGMLALTALPPCMENHGVCPPYPPDPCPVPAGFFKIGSAIYYSDGVAFCFLPSWEAYLEAGGSPDTSDMLELFATPACMENHGVCSAS